MPGTAVLPCMLALAKVPRLVVRAVACFCTALRTKFATSSAPAMMMEMLRPMVI